MRYRSFDCSNDGEFFGRACWVWFSMLNGWFSRY
jgi:hypothetical protein